MRRGKVYLTLLAFTVTGLLSFLVGFTYNVVVAADTSPFPLRVTQILTNDTTTRAEQGKERAVAEVKPLEMFWETYTLIRQRFRMADTPDWKDEKLMYAALDGLLRSLGDPYTRFLDPDGYKQMVEQNAGQFQGIGAYLKYAADGKHVVLAPIANGPASSAGLKRGDVLLKIGDADAVGMDIEKAKNLIRGPAGTKVKLTIGRLPDGNKPEGATNPLKPISLQIERGVIKPEQIEFSAGPPAGHEKEEDIGYIRLQQFNEETEGQLDQALSFLLKKKVKGIVLDLRDNPGGLLDVAIGTASRFMDGGPVVYIQELGGSRRALNGDGRKFQHLSQPIVVLVNRFSASASEILSGALKDRGIAKLVGETTFGKGLVQTIIPLDSTDSSGALKITTAKYFTPAGTDINHKGIKPDVEVVVEPTERDPFSPGTKSAEDQQLNRAVQVLRKDIADGTQVAAGKKP